MFAKHNISDAIYLVLIVEYLNAIANQSLYNKYC